MEIERLQGVENLHVYCERVLGHASRRGCTVVYPCPFGRHSKPHLEVVEWNGKGRWKCWACDKAGDIFDLYGGVNAVDVKSRFREVVEGVCGVLGVTSHDERVTPYRRLGRRRVSRTTEKGEDRVLEPVFLGAEDCAALEACRKRLRGDRVLARELLRELGFSVWLADVCTDEGMGFPALGATEDRRLVYLYHARDDAGRWRLTGAKLRRRAGMRNVRLRLEGGVWSRYGIMDAPENDPAGGARFVSVCGRCFCPWGMKAAVERMNVVITEGESDCLAMVEAVEWFRETYGVNPETGLPFEVADGGLESMLPAVVACPGVSGFRKGWMSLFRGKNVIVAMDGDAAGRKAAVAMVEALSGVCAVRDWRPPEGYKDIREFHMKEGVKALCESVFLAMRGENK